MNSIAHQLKQLGITGQENSEGTEIRIPCPFHEDSSPSASVNLVTGKWICFRGCGSGNFSSLLHRLGAHNDLDFAEGKPIAAHSSRPILRSWRERGFTPEILMKWGIQWDESAGAMRIPVYDDEGETISNMWRLPEGVMPKYRYETGFKKSVVLFGSWRLPAPWPKIVLVEGPLDAVWCQEAGVLAVAILGSVLSKGQMELLMEAQVRHVTLCFDDDEAGYLGVKQAVRLLRAEGMYVYQTLLPRVPGQAGESRCFNDIQEVPLKLVASTVAASHLCVNGSGVIHPRFKRWADGVRPSSKGVWRTR